MSIASPSNADYATVIGYIRDHLGDGTQLSDYEMRLTLAVVKNAISRLSTISTTVAAQMVILQAKGTADASAEIDTADTTITATISVPTYTSSTVADG